MATAMVVVRDGPAAERGWLGLRLALALGVGGREVCVYLHGEGAGWAQPIDARAWLGGDPTRDLQGLIEDLGATVFVDHDEFLRRYAEADQVVAV